MKTYGKIVEIPLHFPDEETVYFDTYIRRARMVSNGRSNTKAFEFYSQEESWCLLPDVGTLLFPDAIFWDGNSCPNPRCLRRVGVKWIKDYFMGGMIFRNVYVAIPTYT